MKRATFTSEEFSLLIFLAARLDPSKYESPMARSVIYKCQTIEREMPDRIRICD